MSTRRGRRAHSYRRGIVSAVSQREQPTLTLTRQTTDTPLPVWPALHRNRRSFLLRREADGGVASPSAGFVWGLARGALSLLINAGGLLRRTLDDSFCNKENR